MEEDFRVGDWLIQPRLNRISLGSYTADLEPKVMQVLVMLARHADEVCLKEQIIQVVWGGVFVSDDVLTRSIHLLRKSLTISLDGAPVIETIPKVGYRMLVRPEPLLKKESIDSIVVVPFEDFDGDFEAAFVGDRIAEGVMNLLAGLPRLRIIARNSAFKFKGKERDLHAMRRDLKANLALTGKVDKREDTLTVQVELVDLAQGILLWGKRYREPLTQVHQIEHAIARDIALFLR